MAHSLDIVIPVYNEGENIRPVLDHLREHVRTPFRVLVCFDMDDDDTLPVLRTYPPDALEIKLVRNPGRGPHSAVRAGFAASDAPAVVMLPADDDYNGALLDPMYELCSQGCDVVVADRFMRGSEILGGPRFKFMLVRLASFCMHHLGLVPAADATNGFRLFSRRLLDSVPIESSRGFSYSIELLVKCHRLRWPIGRVPARWIERKRGSSRFKILSWLPDYLRWFLYSFATTYLFRGPSSVRLRVPAGARRD